MAKNGEGFLFTIQALTLSVALLLPLSLVADPASAQSGEVAPTPEKIVQDASWNELHAQGPQHPVRYRLRKVEAKGSTVKEIVETNDGDVARLIEKNDQPLTPEQKQEEIDRLNNLMAHPEIQAHRHKREQEDNARGDEMVRMLPDAFIYTDDGITPGRNGPCYHFSFKPNPKFIPPDREGEVYHGMAGDVWVDRTQLRLARIEAHLISDVNFGWGFLGKLYKGGSILVEDADVGLHHWETLHMKLDLHGKILMMKSEDFSTTEDSSGFEPVPPQIGYQDAIRVLLKDDVTQTAQTVTRPRP